MLRRAGLAGLLLGAAGVGLTSGCLAAAAGDVSSPGGKQKVEIWLWSAWRGGHSNLEPWLNGLKEQFERLHPGTEVDYVYTDWGPDKLIVAAAAGKVPDASIVSIAYGLDLFDRGLLRPLNSYFARSGIDRNRFFPTTQIFNSRDGQIFGATWSLEAEVLVYNQDLFQAAGLATGPEAMATWDDLVSYAKKLKKTDASGAVTVSGLSLGINLPSFASWLYANGGRFYNEQFNGAGFNSQAGRETLRFLADLFHTHQVVGPGGNERFWAGQVAMLSWETAAGQLLDQARFAVGMTNMPVGPSGQQRSSVGWGNMYVIPAGARNPDLGWEWIRLMLSLEQQIRLTQLYRYPISPLRDVYTSPAWQEVLREKPYLAYTPRIFTQAQVWPYMRYTDASRLIQPLLTAVQQGRLAPETALEQAAAHLNQLLAPAANRR